MAKTDWSALQAEFTREHMRTGISAQDWCEKKGLNYTSARRYIKAHEVKRNIKESLADAPKKAKDKQGKVRRIMRSKLRTEEVAQPEIAHDDETAQFESVDAELSEREQSNAARDASGRFQEGNNVGLGNRGNSSPSVGIQPGERRALKHGGYMRYLNAAKDFFEDAREMSLMDELDFCRARTISMTKTLESLGEMANDPALEPDERLDAISKMLAIESVLDRNTGRIESLERTIDQMWLNAINRPRLKADTQRIIAATRKLTLEADKLSSEGKDKHTPMSEMLEDIQQMGNSGMLN